MSIFLPQPDLAAMRTSIASALAVASLSFSAFLGSLFLLLP
jgi:hypothetical protein